MQKKILILCHSHPDTDPRPNRMIHYLKDKYQVTVVGKSEVRIEGVQSIGLFRSLGDQKRLFKDAQERMRANPLDNLIVMAGRTAMRWLMCLLFFPKAGAQKLVRNIRLILRQYDRIAWSQLGRAKMVQDKLAGQHYDLVISHDISLMPLVHRLVSDTTAKIMLDAREFYPKNFDDQWQWRLNVKPVNIYLCKTYLPYCDKVITVSRGLADEYKWEFDADADVVMSLPDYRDLSPSCINPEQIRIIHHGYASYSRRTEVMIEMMDYVDERFSLDLMLPIGGAYYRKIVSMVNQRKNVRVLPSIPMQEIVPFTNQYDIGLFLCPPTNFNLMHALPNKFFEFIQARLAVAIGPSIEMKGIVEQYGCGIVSHDFNPLSLAQELNSLTPEKIMEYKQKSDLAAKHLNADANRKKILSIVQDLLNE
ncbi:MAG: hypothetical protein JW730_21595 [Anaerolineales bacterium]|nr:hypothetical protein [Anaerolineales bacterium]